MVDVFIEKKNDSYISIVADTSILYELRDVFTFFAEGYKYNPKFKAKIWDGKIKLVRLLAKRRAETYYGLLEKIIKFCKSRKYTYELHDNLRIDRVDEAELRAFTKSLNLQSKGNRIEPRDYQEKTFVDAITHKRQLFVSPTSCLDPETVIDVELDQDMINFIAVLRR